VNQKSVLLLSGASVVLLTSPAIATQPTEAIPDPIPAVAADLQISQPVVVEVQVAAPEQIAAPEQPVEAAQIVEVEQPVGAIAPAPVPTVSPPEPFAPDFSASPAPLPAAVAPDPPEYTEVEAIAPISPEFVENFDQPIRSAVPEASSAISLETLTESTAPSDEWVPRSHDLNNEKPDELLHESDNEFDNESNNELPNDLRQSEHELSEDSPHLYGEPEIETDLIERLAQDDLDQLSPDEWIDLLLSEEQVNPEENPIENLEHSFTDSTAVPELIPEAEFSQAEFEEVEQLPRNVALETDPQSSKLDEPQQPASANAPSTSASNSFNLSFDNEPEMGSPRYRLVVGDRLVFNVQPYRLNWTANDPDSVRKQKLRGRSPAANPNSSPGIRGGVGFNLQISNRTQFQFAYGAPNANDLKSKTVSSVELVAETPTFAQNALLIEADQPVKADTPVEKTDWVERADLIERNLGGAIAPPSPPTYSSTNAIEEIQVTPIKTEKTIATGEPDKSVYNFNGSFEWRIAPTVVLNTWGGLTINPLPPDSPILSLTYLFYLGFPDPFDQEGDRLIFMASQPTRSARSRW
jgi:hypothetical protein